MTKQEVQRAYETYCVKEVDLLLEGFSTPALRIYGKTKELLLTAEIDDRKQVYRISTMNPRFATIKGLRVGSTLGEAKREFGQPVFVDWGEGGIYAAFDFNQDSLSFQLQVEPTYELEHVRDDTKIREIFVVRPF